MLENTFKDPESSDDDGREVNEEHLVELKNFTGSRPENERCEEEESEKRETKSSVNFVSFRHGHSLAWDEREEGYLQGRRNCATFKGGWEWKHGCFQRFMFCPR